MHRIFTDDLDTISAGALYLRVVAPAQLTLAFETVLEGALGGAGYTFWPMVWVVAWSAVRIPLAPWAAATWGLAGVWILLAATAVGRGVSITALWRWGAWERARA